MKHKWHKEIKAWADGAEIECRDKTFNEANWQDVSEPMWLDNLEYRIKPQPKDDLICKSCGQFLHEQQIKEPQYLYVYDHGGSGFSGQSSKIPKWNNMYIGKIKLENDDD